ncbi:MAG: adenine phosphoribosyltransferase [archaeon]
MNPYKKYIASFDGFPKKDVIFWDFTPLLEHPTVYKQAIADIQNHYAGKAITKIAAIEAKGFTIGAALSFAMHVPLCLIRKPNLIPRDVLSRTFEKEYGTGEYALKKDAFNKGDEVLIVYDILAGPGATKAAIALVEETGARVAGCAFVIELDYLRGREHLGKYDVFSLVHIKEKKIR